MQVTSFSRSRGPRLAAALLVAALCAPAASAVAQPSPAVAAFIDATTDYARMHRRLEQITGPIVLNSRPESIIRSIEALAAAIRAERPYARQGDLFTAAVGRELRVSINQALLEHGFTAADVLADQWLDDIAVGAVEPRVNGTFRWVLASTMFPCVIAALPPLPPELEYRIVGRDLVLIDIHASLVVDILPEVLADMTVLYVPASKE